MYLVKTRHVCYYCKLQNVNHICLRPTGAVIQKKSNAYYLKKIFLFITMSLHAVFELGEISKKINNNIKKLCTNCTSILTQLLSWTIPDSNLLHLSQCSINGHTIYKTKAEAQILSQTISGSNLVHVYTYF